MRTLGLSILFLAAAGTACYAQQWEFGGTAGAGFLTGVPVTGVVGSATTGFKSGAAFGAFIGNDLYRHLSGELHYGFLQSDLHIQSGGSDASFAGVAHVVHYDLILHTSRSESKVQFFAAAGGGMKIFRGTGKEAAYQPLSQYAYFTRTQAVKPMISVGGGIKYVIRRNIFLRTEFRDYITPFPTELIAPAPGAKISGLLHDFVPMVGLSVVF
ncbi:MAG TPA: hypothetical protein VG675_08065 [Bryobacteraceae bacterium]|nr:hypothetical protein [Bryobacteraceae bacterium]